MTESEHSWPESYNTEVVHPATGGLLSSFAVALEAWRRGLSVTFLAGHPRRYRVSDDQGRVILFTASRPSLTTTKAFLTAKDKFKTTTALRSAGVAAPQAARFHVNSNGIDEVAVAARSLGYPIVLKPVDGGGGHGVFTDIQSESELVETFAHVTDDLGFPDIVLEKQLPGNEELRVLVIDGEVVAAIRRVAANVVGDGVSTIDELIDRKNANRLRNPFLAAGSLKKDREVLGRIADAGMSLASILPNGKVLRLRGKVNADSGGETEDVTQTLEPEIARLAIDAVQAIPGLFVAGVDVMISRPTADSNFSSASVIELNASPQIGVNMYPSSGEGQDVPKAWIDKCFPQSRRHDAELEKMLAFPLREALDVLDSGFAAEISVAPVPPSRLPFRVSRRCASPERLTLPQKRALLKKARALGVSGELAFEANSCVLHLAGPDEKSSRQMFRRIAGWLPAFAHSEPVEWQGVVRLGFRVRD